ncbi:MAG: TFIIB-type zinc ribbon-containing protein, partial [Defluviitaleaceae bacterium]|nr:TFIIB-type zinc ribbon-containing protein [Defluviitaleaceae bacterium]
GQTKCEKCGSTEISLHVETGHLRCHWCRHEQAPQKFEQRIEDITQLTGQIVGSGASDAIFDEQDAMTLKCTSCAAEVIIDTAESTQARCHWCRNTLSINNQVPNGAVPDKVLPFAVKKEAARMEIEKFVSRRQFFAHPQFKEAFTTDNIMGVYLPYMVVDANVHATFSGEGEIQLRMWTETKTVGSGENKKTVTTTYYDADRYALTREFGMTVEGLTIESHSEKLQHRSSTHTNNVINAIKPFDLEKSVSWDANFMTGYTAQKRDTNVDDLRGMVEVQIKDIARHQIRDTIRRYNRGVRWKSEQLDVIGKQWKAAYFPVWLYSYQTADKAIHYVAVNGQTVKAMGSVPIHKSKLFAFSFFGGGVPGLIIGAFAGILIGEEDVADTFFMLMIIGFILGVIIFYGAVQTRYRNQNARFSHENSTKATVRNMTPTDRLSKKLRRTTAARIPGGDNSTVVNYKGGS